MKKENFDSSNIQGLTNSLIMKRLRFLINIGLMISLTGCFLHSSVTSLGPSLPDATTIFNKTTSIEGVSGGGRYEITSVSGYRVRQTAGLNLNKHLATTPQGYRVYMHVNGRITSEELNR